MTLDYYRRNVRVCNALVVLSGALLLVPQAHGKSPLSSIPTHHGISLESLHLNERGGAVATRRRPWKHYYPAQDRPVRYDVSASYSVELKGNDEAAAGRGEEREVVATKAAPAATSSTKQQGRQDGLSTTAITCMSLLALQFGVQPILVRKFTPQTIVRSSVVLVQEVVKFGIAGAIYFSGTKKEVREKDLQGWSVKTWLALAGLPAFLYTIQNVAALWRTRTSRL